VKTDLKILLAAALVLTTAPGVFSAPGDLLRARQAAAAGLGARALEIAFSGLETSPGDRDLFLYAVELAPETSTAGALRLAAAAKAGLAKKDSDNAWYLGLCKALRISGKPDEALSDCKKAMELDPTVYPPYRELGLTYAAAGNPRRAAETLQQGLELYPALSQAYYNLALILEKRGDSVRAYSYYEKGLATARRGKDPDAGYYSPLLLAGQERTARQRLREKKAWRVPQTIPGKSLGSCLAKFKAEFLKDNLGAALSRIDACVKLSPRESAIASDRAPLLVRLGRYEDGVKEYERAASLYAGKPDMAAFCYIKAAETWIKLGDTPKAVARYRLALTANPKDLNALKGLAAAQDSLSDTAGGIETYAEILKLDPSDARAKTRLEELRTDALTPDQMLAEMKFRQAVDAAKTELSPDDIKLFKAIRAAEIAGGVDYVMHNMLSPQGLIARKDSPDGVKLFLTAAGYKTYIALATRDAVKFFEGKDVGMRDIFQLRDLSGAPIFDAGGKLTAEGAEAWRRSADGTKTWLLKYEPVPQSPQAAKAAQAEQEMAAAKKRGYDEISQSEYTWLLRATNCPEDVLEKSPVDLLHFNDGSTIRYMACLADGSGCMPPGNSPKRTISTYIGKYRSGDTTIPGERSSAFFGTGSLKRYHFCEDGKIWEGETN
jgi:tetratricopeptide (TPR) repeat protein